MQPDRSALHRAILQRATALAVLALATPAAAAQLDFSPPVFLPGDDADGLAAGQHTQVEIAASDDGFLAVWSDSRSSMDDWQGETASGFDVYGAILDADGQVVVRSLVIDQGPGNQANPCVAWNGHHWLVAWVEQDPGGSPTYDRIRAVRVAPDGTLVDSTPFVVHEDDYYFSYEGPAMASAGDDGWVVVVPTNDVGLRAVRVSSYGTITTPPLGVLVTQSNGDFDIAFANGQYVIVYGGGSGSAPRANRYTPTLQPTGSTALPFADEVATDGTRFMVVDTNNDLWPPTLQALVLNSAGNVVVPPVTIKVGTAVSGPSGEDVGFDGTNFWVTWGGTHFARVTAAGQVLDPDGFTIPSITGYFGWLPAYATAPGGGLQLVWSHGESGAGSAEDAYTGRLTPAGAVIDQAPVSLSAPAQVEPAFAKGQGVNVIAIWSRSSDSARILAQRVDDDGLALDAEPIEVASGPLQWLEAPSVDAPDVAWNGSVFMVTWSDKVDVLARRMNPDGSFVDAAPIVVMDGQSSAVGALGGVFLVGGSTVGTLTGTGYYRVARVDGASGAVLDDPPTNLSGSGAGTSGRLAHIEAFGGRWLVVWESVYQDPWSTFSSATTAIALIGTDGSIEKPAAELGPRPSVAVAGDRALVVAVDGSLTSATADIEGRVLLPDGSFLGPRFPISTAPNRQFSPAAAWNGTEFVVAWEDERDAVAYFDHRVDVWGARVDPTGVVLDPAGVALASAATTELSPTFLSVGATTFMATSVLRADTPLGSYRLGLQRHEPGGVVCQTDLGYGGPGHAALQLCGDALASGGAADLVLSGAAPQAPVALVVGSVLAPTPLFGGLVVPVPADSILPLVTDVAGQVALLGIIGGGGPLTVYAQAVWFDASLPQSFGISNALEVQLLP